MTLLLEPIGRLIADWGDQHTVKQVTEAAVKPP
jgi:hypothetical protein